MLSLLTLATNASIFGKTTQTNLHILVYPSLTKDRGVHFQTYDGISRSVPAEDVLAEVVEDLGEIDGDPGVVGDRGVVQSRQPGQWFKTFFYIITDAVKSNRHWQAFPAWNIIYE
jgi:hypothetical protein